MRPSFHYSYPRTISTIPANLPPSHPTSLLKVTKYR